MLVTTLVSDINTCDTFNPWRGCLWQINHWCLCWWRP